MEKRQFGKTGLETTVLGFGGFHLCEIPVLEAEYLLNEYLDAGGNYIETAASYGHGESERKIGQTVSKRRDEYILTSKVNNRDRISAAVTIDNTLRNLKTDHLDVLLLHGVETPEVLEKTLREDGAYQAAIAAKKAGKVNHIGLSMHGQPDALLAAMDTDLFETVMTTVNYYDRCNFPEIEKELLPKAAAKGVGVILMKPIADGYLWQNTEQAFRYAFSRPVSVVVTGINNREMLRTDLALAQSYKGLSLQEEESILQNAPEFEQYVCRQCGQCHCPIEVPIMEIAACEALFDRQMARGSVHDPATYALSERLKGWFGQSERGLARYAKLDINADSCTSCGACKPQCPYHVDIPYKMQLCAYKLGQKPLF